MIEVRPMDEGYLHTCCLHSGPVDSRNGDSLTMDLPEGHPQLPWGDVTLLDILRQYRKHQIGHPRPEEFQKEMIRRYGTCAMLAWDGDFVVGHLRFFPMALARLLWQPDPSPILDCTLACEPGEDEGTLWVQCVMTAQPHVGPEPIHVLGHDWPSQADAGARKGVGLQLVRALIEWATQQGWQRIVKVAHCDLDWFYGIQGGGGRAFWEKAGFRVANAFYLRAWEFEPDAWKVVQRQMQAKGMTEREVWTWYRMVYEL